ncbi:MAG: hypothetical protein ACRECQ_15370, partial [Burkholderiaceae bacterium]
RASLDALASLLADRQSDRYETLDWNQPEAFVTDLQRLVSELGHPAIVLAWLHDMTLGPHIAAAVSTPEAPCDFFQVIGSTGGSPQGGATVVRDRVKAVSSVTYFQIVLGFKRETISSRWLTNDEISDGVLDAIRKREACRWHCHSVATKTLAKGLLAKKDPDFVEPLRQSRSSHR